MMNRMVLVGAVVAGLWLACGIAAEDAPAAHAPLRELLKQADANGDGTVTFEELSAAAPDLSRKKYDRLDRNKDGVITDEDRPPQGPAPEKPAPFPFQKFREADTDGDGKVTLDELKVSIPEMTQAKFDTLDRNKDGVITGEDRPPQRPGASAPDFYQRFLKADKNNDGKVTLEEVKTVAPKMTQAKFDTLDRNKDGVITGEDRPPQQPDRPGTRPAPPAAERFRAADKDGDGKVTFEELKAVIPNMTREKFDTLDADKDGAVTPGERPGGRPGPPRPTRQQMLQKADANHDQQVTYEELSAARPGMTQEMFKRLDTNSDGVISSADRSPGRARGERPGRGGQPGMLSRLRQADSDGDGKTTREEARVGLPNLPDAAFNRFDRNGDGVISKEDAVGR